jgi:thiamine-phosphate pyrophosphorylase
LSASRRAELRLPIVCLVTDRTLVDARRLPEAAAEAAAGGVNLVQLREKDLPTRELLDLARKLRAALDPLGVPLIVNGRADVAFAAGAAGVHLPADGLPVAGARAALGTGVLVGRSVHSADEALQIANEDVDYVVLGTMFPSASHVNGPTIGVHAVRAGAGSKAPLVAIGGITAENAGSVIAAGADGVAVISAILGSSDPRAAARELSQAVREAWASRRQPAELSPSPSGKGLSASRTPSPRFRGHSEG